MRSADDGRPVAVLTNVGTLPCRVAAGALGSLTVATASQGGAAIPPTTAELSFADEPHERIASTLRVLEPGQSASQVAVQYQGSSGLRLEIRPAASRRGRLEGLFGDFDGRPENDLRLRDGATLGPEKPEHDDLYPRCSFDVALTGDADDAQAAVSGQASRGKASRGALRVDGPPVAVRLGAGSPAEPAFGAPPARPSR